jgi:hypothetical protein
MNKPIALKRVLDSTDSLSEQFLNDQEEVVTKPEPDSLAETPHRASAVTLRISDMLARVEGVQRWGLNE